MPPVVGELAAGVVLGPTVLGVLAPDLADAIVPGAGPTRTVLDGLAFLGMVLLLATTGASLDLHGAARLVRARPWVPVLSLLVPLAVGLAVGAVLPERFLGPVDRSHATVVVAIVLAVSALPTIARALSDLGLLHRDVGQLTLASAAVDDVAGWFLLAVTSAALAGEGGGRLVVAVLTAAAFFAVALAAGRRVYDLVLTVSLRMTETVAGPLTTVLVLVLATTGLAMATGLDPAVGALVAGLLLGGSPALRPRVRAAVDEVGAGFFAPLFFALVGATLDLGELTLADLAWTLALLAAAMGAKVAGAVLGASLSGLPTVVGRAVGIGLAARGGLGVVVASFALSAGVLSPSGHAALVVVAVASSLLAPLLLSSRVAGLPADDDARGRLARDPVVDDSVAAARHVLLLTRGGAHSRVAARVCDLVLHPSARVTVLVVSDPAGDVLPEGAALPAAPGTRQPKAPDAVGRGVASLLGTRRTSVRVVTSTDVAEAVLAEAVRGHDLLVVGASGAVQAPAQLGPVLGRVLLGSPVPCLLVRSRTDAEGLAFTRLLTTAPGTDHGRGAQDVAFALARSAGAAVDVLHVIARPDRILHASWFRNADRQPAPHHLLAEAGGRAADVGVDAGLHVRVGSAAAEEVLALADELQADTVVTATTIRDLGERPFLGHGVEYLLERATQNLVVVAHPRERG